MLAYRRHVWLCLLLFILAGGPPASTQAPSLTGTVTDPSGAVLPGVAITITRPSMKDVVAVSDERGRFVVAGLRPGPYHARFELAGFATVVVRFVVWPDRPATLAVQLTVGALTESVTVTSRGAPLETSSSSRAVSSVPAGRAVGNWYAPPVDREQYRHQHDSGFQRVSAHPLSTFSIDADTASYANVRRMLNDGALPPEGAVRIEELINYFDFEYAAPSGDKPVSITTELGRCPWDDTHWLALVGVRAADRPRQAPSGRRFTFLLDVSGSMQLQDKLPLVKQSLRLLAEQLTPRDRVAIVVYAGASGLVLPSTPGDETSMILAAIDRLEAGGSTNGGAGIELAYRIAREHYDPSAVNRVILATDGDFNVGVTSEDQLIKLIERERKSGVFLSVLGVGTGNLQDATMESLADKGNGNYSYLDSLDEARKVLVRESSATLVTVAKDVKIQIEFNPQQVEAYRLIGYENRRLQSEDFNDDEKDAGEMGASDSVTALYEIVPKGVPLPSPQVDALKYQRTPERTRASGGEEVLTVKLRYKDVDASTSERIEAIVSRGVQALSGNLGFASAVAEFGMLLRHSPYAGRARFESALTRAKRFRGDDPTGDRAGFAALVQRAIDLSRARSGQTSQ
jgi:Ca-activated chloride channel family protein